MKKLALTPILLSATLFLIFTGHVSVSPQSIPYDSLYFGQTPPGDSAVIFAPGIISLTNRRETKIVFSPDGNECLIGIGKSGAFKILYTKYDSGHWSVPGPANFITTVHPIEPFFSPDGQKIFFTSYADIYVCYREGQAWTAPVKLNSPVNSAAEEYHATVTSDGTLYFCSNRSGQFYIYRSYFENGNYNAVEKLDKIIPSPNGAWDPFIAPDESYIIFTTIRSDGFGQEDQYISYNKNSVWTNPKNLGPSINTNAIEYGSYISTDNKYYFFSRPAGWGPNTAADIYWIKTDNLIDSLEHTNFVPYLKNVIPDQADTAGQLFNYTFPDSTFTDDDGNQTLTYSATLSDGSPLPSWLSFDSLTRTFAASPLIAGQFNIKVMATDTAGASAVCTFRITGINVVGIEEEKDRLPGKLILHQNYPNPFNPSTKIEFTTPENNFVAIKLYNTLGVEVASILDEFKPAGSYFVEFNANKLASGLYVYKIVCGKHTEIKKMLLLK